MNTSKQYLPRFRHPLRNLTQDQVRILARAFAEHGRAPDDFVAEILQVTAEVGGFELDWLAAEYIIDTFPC